MTTTEQVFYVFVFLLIPIVYSIDGAVEIGQKTTTGKTWMLISGFTCAKQGNFQPATRTIEPGYSEEACVETCALNDECHVAQFLDFSHLTTTGNQKFCSLYSGYASCFGNQAVFFQRRGGKLYL